MKCIQILKRKISKSYCYFITEAFRHLPQTVVCFLFSVSQQIDVLWIRLNTLICSKNLVSTNKISWVPEVFSRMQKVAWKVSGTQGTNRDQFITEMLMKYQDFSFYQKIISSSRAVKILFLSFTSEDIGVAMVTNVRSCCYRIYSFLVMANVIDRLLSLDLKPW